MSAEDLLKELVSRYAVLTSYQDSGVVLSHWPEKPGPDVIHFTTHFVRPAFFKFDWTSHHPYPPLRHLVKRRAVWSDGNSAYSYWSHTGETTLEENLDMAVAGATGVSSGSAHNVPALFTDLISGIRVTNLQKLSLLDEGVFENVSCYRVQGDCTYMEEPNCLWIGKDDFLLRKIESWHSKYGLQEEIHRDIVVNAAIPEEAFVFQPPPKESTDQ